MVPTKQEKEEIKQRKMKGTDDDSENGAPFDKVVYEMNSSKMQQDNQVPFTPRTQAFHALDRKLPLRGS